jgi:hypothetical protein
MRIEDTTSRNRKLTLAPDEALHSGTLSSALQQKGHSPAEARELCAQIFDCLEEIAHAQRIAAA